MRVRKAILLYLGILTDGEPTADVEQVSRLTTFGPFPFMKLPFDIRRLIYEVIYPTKQRIDCVQAAFHSINVEKNPNSNTAFLRSCRQVKDEI